jgi:integrase
MGFGCFDDVRNLFIVKRPTPGSRHIDNRKEAEEARALTHGDVDLKRDTVTIERAFSGTELRPFTKTKRVRVIPLDESWRELYLQQPRNIDPQAFVFTRNGKPFSMTLASKKWREPAIKAGYPNINLYEGTRRSIASQAVNRHVPRYSVSKFLGHSNMKQTERYSHLNTSGLRKVQRQAPIIERFSAKCLQRKK